MRPKMLKQKKNQNLVFYNPVKKFVKNNNLVAKDGWPM